MNKELIVFCRKSYAEFEDKLGSTWGFEAEQIAKLPGIVRKAHKAHLSHSSLCAILGAASERNSHIGAAPETSLLALVLSGKGMMNPACVLLRQCIELTLKHIYFSTHPVEYSWSETRIGYREITHQFLLDYISKTDELSQLTLGTEALEGISHEFGILSRFVHAHSREFHQFDAVPTVEEDNFKILRKFSDYYLRTLPQLCYLLIGFFPQEFLKANSNEKCLMRSILPPDLSKSAKEYLKALAEI